MIFCAVQQSSPDIIMGRLNGDFRFPCQLMMSQSFQLKRLGHHQLAGKPEIAVQTTHDYVRTALLDCTEDHALFHFHRPLVRGVFIMLELKKDCRTEASVRQSFFNSSMMKTPLTSGRWK